MADELRFHPFSPNGEKLPTNLRFHSRLAALIRRADGIENLRDAVKGEKNPERRLRIFNLLAEAICIG